MFWLIAMIASMGVGVTSVVVTLNRMGGDHEKRLRTAPELAPSDFAEGTYGRITGVATATPAGEAPGIGTPCVLYELVVYRSYSSTHNTTDWKIVHRALVGDDVIVTVGDVVVRVAVRDVYLVSSPTHDETVDLRERQEYGTFRSRVRFVPDGAIVDVVGTLTREVDDDPAAPRDYRETATRYRLIGTRKQPIVLSCEPRQLARTEPKPLTSGA